MIKKIFAVLVILVLMFSLIGCVNTTTYEETIGQAPAGSERDMYNGYFTIIQKWERGMDIPCYIAYANDTKVKYLIVTGSHHSGITPLYNADGTLQIYDGE